MASFRNLVEPGETLSYFNLLWKHLTTILVDPFWDEHREWLEAQGYVLRRDYHPGWVKTWKSGDIIRWEGSGRDSTPVIVRQHLQYHYITSLLMMIFYQRCPFVDAVSTSSGRAVMLKHVDKIANLFEVGISLFFSSGPRASDPRNHCVPIIEVLQLPDNEDVVVLVMPLLQRFSESNFGSLGDVLDFLSQLFEVGCLAQQHLAPVLIIHQGLQFMHRDLVAHRRVVSDPYLSFIN